MARWNPWRALRAREHLTLVVARLPDGIRGAWLGDHIVLDHRLGRRERNATLAHELVHDERGIGSPAATPATMQREEAIVRRITAERLVPAEELAELAAQAELEPVEVWRGPIVTGDPREAKQFTTLAEVRQVLEEIGRGGWVAVRGDGSPVYRRGS